MQKKTNKIGSLETERIAILIPKGTKATDKEKDCTIDLMNLAVIKRFRRKTSTKKMFHYRVEPEYHETLKEIAIYLNSKKND
jgi:hypothetical protein